MIAASESRIFAQKNALCGKAIIDTLLFPGVPL